MPLPSEPRLVPSRSSSPTIRLPPPPLGELIDAPGVPALLKRSRSLHLEITPRHRVSHRVSSRQLDSSHETLEGSGSSLARALGLEPQNTFLYDSSTRPSSERSRPVYERSRPLSESIQISTLARSLHGLVLEEEHTVDFRGRSRERQTLRRPESSLLPSLRRRQARTSPTNVRVPTPTPLRADSVKRLDDVEYLMAYGLSNNFYNNVVSWSRFSNRMVVGVDKNVYWWVGRGNVERIEYDGECRSPVTCVSCSELHYVAISTLEGKLYVYDESSDRIYSHKFPAALKCIKWMHMRNMFVAGDTKGSVYFGGIGQNNIYVVSEVSVSSQQICGT